MKKLTLLLSCLFLSACVSGKDTPNISYYSLENATQSVPSDTASETVVRVMPVSIVPQYSVKNFIYRTGETNYVSDPYRQFHLAPSLQITQYLTNAMQDELDVTIVSADSLLIANYVVQFDVSKLYADYQNKNAPEAMTSISALLYYVTPTRTAKIGEEIFSAQQAIAPNDAKSLIKGYNKNLTAISNEADTWIAQHIAENDKATKDKATKDKATKKETTPA